MEDKDLTDIEKQIYAAKKAEAEAHEIAEIAQDSTKALQTKLNTKVAEHIDKSQKAMLLK